MTNHPKNSPDSGDTTDDAQSSSEQPPAVTAAVVGRLKHTLGGALPASIKWRNFLTAKEDATIGRVSFMSKPPEWHAAGVGFATTLFVAATVLLNVPLPTLFAVGAGSGIVATRTVRRFLTSKHFRDAVKEPAYAALGVLLAVGLLASSRLATAPSVQAGFRMLVGG